MPRTTVQHTCLVKTLDEPSKLPTLQIGKLGELLVQYKLLRYGIESAPLTTDAGIDLVAYAPGGKRARSIQVKANLKPARHGGEGRPYIHWWVPAQSPAELIALVDLSTDRVWLLTMPEFTRMAQQHSRMGHQLYMYLDPETRTKLPMVHVKDFERYRLECRITDVFGPQPTTPPPRPRKRRATS